jgi:hypothetical protein
MGYIDCSYPGLGVGAVNANQQNGNPESARHIEGHLKGIRKMVEADQT